MYRLLILRKQILFNVLLGLRRQEINGLKYSDVDYINRTISVERQLGKELNREPYAPNDGATKKELQLKTFSSKRVLPLPDLVFEAIDLQLYLLQRIIINFLLTLLLQTLQMLF